MPRLRRKYDVSVSVLHAWIREPRKKLEAGCGVTRYQRKMYTRVLGNDRKVQRFAHRSTFAPAIIQLMEDARQAVVSVVGKKKRVGRCRRNISVYRA